jgi:hypothetical protein
MEPIKEVTGVEVGDRTVVPWRACMVKPSKNWLTAPDPHVLLQLVPSDAKAFHRRRDHCREEALQRNVHYHALFLISNN